MNIFSLEGKVCVVTGGYGHLGKGIVDGLVSQQATVWVMGKSQASFDAVFKGLVTSNKLNFIEGDIADTQSVKSSLRNIEKEAGKIDVFINNAFYSKGRDPETMSDEEWQTGIDGTLSSVFRCIREAIPYLKKTQGKIINVSSMYGAVAPDFAIYENHPEFLNPPHYGAAKAGVIQLTKYYASFLAPYNITVNCVSPGPFPSPGVQQHAEFIDQLKAKTLLRRIGKPEDLAGVFVFLASDASNFVTGQNIRIDGGWTVK
jgi:NAD(P)-dependent dehydrogenase (short-subunit alcohol dehydrogenase family)